MSWIGAAPGSRASRTPAPLDRDRKLGLVEWGGNLAPMSDADIAEILKLPAGERLRLLEIIWESLASDPSSLPLGDAHRAALDEALTDLARNPDDVVSLDEVMANARRR